MNNINQFITSCSNSPFTGRRADLSKLKYFFIIVILLILNNFLHAQNSCYTDQIHEKLLQTDSVYKQKNIEKTELIYNKLIQNKIKAFAIADTSVKYIPIVVHVIHNGETIGTGTNISDAQIKATIDYTNKIYANAFGSSTNFKIQFVLVCIDKNGNTTTGIERINGNTITGYTPQNQADLNDYSLPNSITNIGQKLNWDIQKYYNIYIVEKFNINNVAGVAFFPNNYFFQSDASFIAASQFTIGNPTLPHELGHSLNLAHTFTGGCSTPSYNCLLDGDGVCDTPPHEQNECSDLSKCISSLNQDNKNSKYNYMSYCHVYGVIQNVFTLGQNQRANASLGLISRASLINNAYNVASCNVNVKKYTITTKVINGTISNTVVVDSNSNYTITYTSLIKPKPDSIFINNVSVPINVSNTNSFNFTNIVSDQLIKVVYNLDTTNIDTNTCNRIIFKDNFNNNTFDTLFWVNDAINKNDIRVENNIMKLEQNYTDRKTYLYSKWFNVDSTSSILIERDVLIHVNGNAPSYISMSLNFNDSFIICDHPYITYFNNYYEDLYGIYVSSDFRNYRDLCYKQRVRDVLFDNWFKEKFLYNLKTGEYKYWVNDTLYGNGIFKKPGTQVRNFRLNFNPWSWNTGHYQYFDNFVLTEIKNCNSDTNINNGLILYLPFNGDTKDQIDTNNAVNKGATLTTDRKEYCNRAYNFNGIDNSMDIPYNRNLLPNYDKKTYSFWLKFKDSTSQFSIQNGDGDLSGGQFQLYVNANNKNGFMNLSLNSWWNIGDPGIDDFKYSFPANFNYNIFHLYTYTIDSLKTDYFIDSVKVASRLWRWAYKPFDAPTITNPYNNVTYTNNIRIGYYLNTASFGEGGYNGYFKGSLDELRIYNRILSNTEIYKLFLQTPLDDPLGDKTSCAERKIIATEVKNGLITPIISVTKGTTTRIQYQPANAKATLDSIIINNLYVGKDSINGYTFTNVQNDQTIKVVYTLSNNTTIFSINKSIIKTNDSLIVTGNNISFLHYKSYPDSGKLNFILKRAVSNANPLINTIDTQYYFIIPANFENKLYQLHGIGYNNSISNLKLIRVYNFDPEYVGITSWNDKGRLENIPNNLNNLIYIKSKFYSNVALDINGKIFAWVRNDNQNFIGNIKLSPNLANIVDFGQSSNVNIALNSDGQLFRFDENGIVSPLNNIIPILNLDGNAIGIYGINENNFFTDIYGSNLNLQINNLNIITAANSTVYTLVKNNLISSYDFGINNCQLNINEVKDLSGAATHFILLKKDSTVEAYSKNCSQSYLDFTNSIKNVVKISAEGEHSFISNIAGKVLDFGSISMHNPSKLEDIVSVSTGYNYTIALNLLHVYTSIENGTIKSSQFVKRGTDLRVTYIPNTGYKIDSIFINDEYKPQITIDSINGVTFKNLNSTQIIRVVCKLNATPPPPPPPKFCISTQVINGNITPKICIDSNTNYRITYSPIFNSILDSVFINNIYNSTASKDSINGFTFFNINKNNEIKVLFLSTDKNVEPSDILTPLILDGQFDNWQIKNINIYPENEISIYNKFNIEVIHFENYTNANAWSGLDRYGNRLTSGVYYYIIKLKLNNQILKIIKGTLTILN